MFCFLKLPFKTTAQRTKGYLLLPPSRERDDVQGGILSEFSTIMRRGEMFMIFHEERVSILSPKENVYLRRARKTTVISALNAQCLCHCRIFAQIEKPRK